MAVQMAVVQAPAGGLYRIARGPDDPFALSDWDRAGDDGTFGNRFDDPGALFNIPPEERYRVIYCATQCQASIGEITARFRQVPGLRARLDQIDDDQETTEEALGGAVDPEYPDRSLLTHDWLQRRRIGHTKLDQPNQFVDITHADTLSYLNQELAPVLEFLNIGELDLSSMTSQSRRLTQYASRYIYARGFDGIRYTSRLGDNWECWALFEGRFRHAMGYPDFPISLSPENEDLIAVAGSFGITIELMRGMGIYLRPWQDYLV